MIQTKLLLSTFLFSVLLFSCKTKYEYNAEGMAQVTEALNSKFGTDAWYTGVTIRTISEKESALVAEVTEDPNSLKQEQWSKQGDSWQLAANVSLQIQNGKPQDYMFQLGKQASLTTLNELIQKCREKLEEVEQISDGQVTFASIKSATEVRNADERILYTVSMHSPSNNKSYSFVFNQKGKLKDFNN